MGVVYSHKNNSSLLSFFNGENENTLTLSFQLNRIYWDKKFELDINFDFSEEDFDGDILIDGVTFYRYHQKSYVTVTLTPSLYFSEFEEREEYYQSEDVEWYSYDEEKGSHTFGTMPLRLLLSPDLYSKVIPHQKIKDEDVESFKEMCIDYVDSSSDDEILSA